MKSKKELDAVFVIYDTEKNKLWHRGTKIAWVSEVAAKAAWLRDSYCYDENMQLNKSKFDDQTRYVIVEIHEDFIRNLKEASID